MTSKVVYHSAQEMDPLKSTIKDAIRSQHNGSGSDSTLLITPDEVRQELERVKSGKSDGGGS